jgi:hypothetical protein
LTVTDSVDYSRGSVSGSFGDTDRFVLAFSSGIASPASKLLVVGVSGSTLTALTSGALERFEASALADSISIVSLTRLIYVLTYRVRGSCAGQLLLSALGVRTALCARVLHIAWL